MSAIGDKADKVAISRANHRVTYLARFMLVAMNPCRCGRASDPGFTCRRGPNVRCAAARRGAVVSCTDRRDSSRRLSAPGN
jgi:predicted ATPase with chaperone activity